MSHRGWQVIAASVHWLLSLVQSAMRQIELVSTQRWFGTHLFNILCYLTGLEVAVTTRCVVDNESPQFDY